MSAGSKSNLAKAAGAEVALQRTQEKSHAAVARSTFSSQNAQNMSWADHFLKLRWAVCTTLRLQEAHF